MNSRTFLFVVDGVASRVRRYAAGCSLRSVAPPPASGALALLMLTLLVSACATNPATGKREFSLMSEEQEIAIGQQQDPLIRQEMGVYADRELQQYVSDIGLKLARVSERPNLPWHFTVVDVPAINAFALPGGYIYITRGIMAFLQDEAQLAGVLGHEIGHVTARHAAEQYSRATGAQIGLALGSIFLPGGQAIGQLGGTGLELLFLKYGRDDEAESDALGVRYASRTGWDPAGVPGMLATLGRIEAASDDKGVPNWLLTHPAPEDRVQRVQEAVKAASADGQLYTTNRDGFLRRIDGIMFGDNPDQGIVRGSRFIHPGLRFAVDFPAGWSVQNGQTQVVAKPPGANVVVVLQPVPQPQGSSIRDVALSSMQRAGFSPASGHETSINGLPAFVGTYHGSLSNLGRVVVRAAHIRQGTSVYLVAGIAPRDVFAREEQHFTKSIESFRPITKDEAEAVRPNRIDLYTVRTGDTWQSIADRPSKGLINPQTLAIMNGHSPSEPPRPGERVKIVVGG